MTPIGDGYAAEFAKWCAEQKARARAYQQRPAVGGNVLTPGRRNPDGSYMYVYRKIAVRPARRPLPMPRVLLQGPRWWRFCRDSQPDPNCWRQNVYDFTSDVRELVLEPIRFDVYAEWADPRERLTC